MEENHMRETEDDAQKLYSEINQIMEEREGIEKEMREIHNDMELFDDVQREIRGIFKEIWKHCEEDIFIMRLEEYEEDIGDSGRKMKTEWKKEKKF